MKNKLKPLVGLCILSLLIAAAWLPGEKVQSADQGRATPGMTVYTPAETPFLDHLFCKMVRRMPHCMMIS
jgi:hypothetical protein